MSHPVKTKPDKIFAKLGKFEYSGPENTVLDLFRGFSTPIHLEIGCNEGKNVNYYFPVFVEPTAAPWSDNIDLGRALQMGLLEIADDNDRAVSVEPVDQELEILGADLQKAEPTYHEIHPLWKVNARLLSRLRQCLLPGKQYKLRFCGPHFTIWSKFENRKSTDHASLIPSKWPEDERNQMICDPEPLPFTVVRGVRVPRFTASFSTSSSKCYLDNPRPFFVTLKVTSLEDRPVTVFLQSYDFAAGAYPDEWYPRTSFLDDVIDILDEEVGKWGVFYYNVGRFDEESSKRVALPLLQFNKGTSYTRIVGFSLEELSKHECKWPHDFGGLTPGKTYKIASGTMGYVTWDYGRAHELREKYPNQGDWDKHGPIIFEPVSAVALTIKAIFEREKPKPFFSLPLELRDQVYEYMRWSERANEVRFTAKESREPVANGVAGALRSG